MLFAPGGKIHTGQVIFPYLLHCLYFSYLLHEITLLFDQGQKEINSKDTSWMALFEVVVCVSQIFYAIGKTNWCPADKRLGKTSGSPSFVFEHHNHLTK